MAFPFCAFEFGTIITVGVVGVAGQSRASSRIWRAVSSVRWRSMNAASSNGWPASAAWVRAVPIISSNARHQHCCQTIFSPSSAKSRATAASYFCVRQFHVRWTTLMVAVSPSSAKMCEFFLPDPSHQNRARRLARVKGGKGLREA